MKQKGRMKRNEVWRKEMTSETFGTMLNVPTFKS